MINFVTSRSSTGKDSNVICDSQSFEFMRYMTRHPSLDAPFISPSPLNPQLNMPRNVLCWCQSGKKWKNCHRDRDQQSPINVGALVNQIYLQSRKGYCSHPEAGENSCGKQIIQSHTVQRKGSLSAISEKGHVVSTHTYGLKRPRAAHSRPLALADQRVGRSV